MNTEQFEQFWEQLKVPLKAKWVGISDKDLAEIEGNLDTFRTILSKRYGELRKDEVLRWAHQRYCHWSGNYIDDREETLRM
ncbi:MAG: CsbD family protein [Nitrospira sp. WS110]|nr:CsbD family protein [Nitrospira sp. WS110]